MALSDFCWIWDGVRHTSGYGYVTQGEHVNKMARRVIWEMMVGPIPDGMQLDHVCRQRGCVNPKHLRVVTQRENLLAFGSKAPVAANAIKTHCPRGHAFDAENTYRAPSAPDKRICRSCRHDQTKAFFAKNKSYKADWRAKQKKLVAVA
jgi:hypothetical protein